MPPCRGCRQAPSPSAPGRRCTFGGKFGGAVRIEHGLSPGGSRRGVEADGNRRCGDGLLDAGMEQVLECGGARRVALAIDRSMSPSFTISTAMRTAAAAVRLPTLVWRITTSRARS